MGRRYWAMIGLVISLWFGLTAFPAQAESLSARLDRYPAWHEKPSTQAARGDLAYPAWLTGDWYVETTLLDMVAPLAPAIVSPGFESNRDYINQPVGFDVRFGPQQLPKRLINSQGLLNQTRPEVIVADRAFNGMNIARAYMGENFVTAVKVDPSNPNRQITLLKGNRQLESTISDRAIEQPDATHFITTEVFQQVFHGTNQPYLNQVETTTAYSSAPDAAKPIVADQVTAIYLSPNDENYFKAGDTPVALYRYRLEFFPPAKKPLHNATLPAKSS
jgi:hypothetical protein